MWSDAADGASEDAAPHSGRIPAAPVALLLLVSHQTCWIQPFLSRFAVVIVVRFEDFCECAFCTRPLWRRPSGSLDLPPAESGISLRIG